MHTRIFTALILMAALTGPALADGFNNADMARYWGKHADAERAIFEAFRTGAPVADYSQPFLDLVRWESQLVLTGLVRADSPKLVARLAKDENFTLRGPYDYPQLAYRIFKQEFSAQSGYDPNPVELFDWVAIKVQPR